MDELRPCPFVPGGLHELSIVESNGDEYSVGCKCGARGPIYGTPELAIEAWNARTPPPTEGEEITARLTDAEGDDHVPK